jgi:ubiquitin C-terminal hydrolase
MLETGDFEEKSLDSESEFTEKLWMQARPKFLLIEIAREELVNDQSENDCHPFKFPINLDMAPYEYLHAQGFRYQLAAVVAHLGYFVNGTCHYITCGRRSG